MKKRVDNAKSTVLHDADPTECPFREFRDNELGIEYWGQGPTQFRASVASKSTTKPPQDYVWVDDQTQPLPRSVRNYLHGWMRADELSSSRWDAEVVIFEDTNNGKMSVVDIQLSHAQVLLRSSFCRKVLSVCYMLERTDGLTVEHTWENFSFNYGPEGWRARYHIYSPGMKAGGGLQHRPGISKCGCYLVRLYYLGAWRCVWVSDQVPVDATDSPLLPFSPLLSHATTAIKSAKQIPELVTSGVVQLWPLLLCKALLKLAAPDMNSDEEIEEMNDEILQEFDVLHYLTGSMSLLYGTHNYEKTWKLLSSEVQMFTWDDDDETVASTVKSKSVKKFTNKDVNVIKRSMVSAFMIETKDEPPYALPGITPAHEMSVIVTMARDLPLKKPLPEPEVAPWKTYRWIDWARRHGLYDAYDCPRNRFLKVNGLLKLSYAPHLLEVQSTDSITFCFREEQEKQPKKNQKDQNRSVTAVQQNVLLKEELREWVQYEAIHRLIRNINILYYPSIFQFTTTASNPPVRTPTKVPLNKALDISAPKSTPLYLQIDGPEENKLKLSLNALHPRILSNSGVLIVDYIEPSYFVLEVFEWFKNTPIPRVKAFVQTRGYNSAEVTLLPGRHFCRLWVHSRMNWHAAVLSESTLLLGSRDMIQCAAVRECPWGAKFLLALGASFNNWIRVNRSTTNIVILDREFFSSYQPDLYWDPDVVGYQKSHVHWMFRHALQALLAKKLQMTDFQTACNILRRYFMDPDFGLPPKPTIKKSLREIAAMDPCDCLMPEVEEVEGLEELYEEQILTPQTEEGDEKSLFSPDTMDQLLTEPVPPIMSQVCELATEELPCGILKHEREKIIRRHEAATYLQALWRGTWTRKCLRSHITANSEAIKLLMDNAFGNIDVLQALMKEFFSIYPGAKYAYSVSSALNGICGLHQHYGTTPMTPKCKWIPYFQGIFFCHHHVKVHFDILSTLPYSTVAVYNNDNGNQMPQAYNAHVTFDFQPNNNGYTVIGHGTVNNCVSVHCDVHWQLTVMTSIDNVFHICDNSDNELCSTTPLPPAFKLRLEEIYIPNRRSILGGMMVAVTRNESVSFRATTTFPGLDIEAVLRTTNSDGQVEEIARCAGKGEICWSYVHLKASHGYQVARKKSASHASLSMTKDISSARPAIKKRNTSAAVKSKSTTKIVGTKPAPVEPKQYVIEVIAPDGWPLILDQWRRVDIIRNDLVPPKVDTLPKKGAKEKAGSAKEKPATESKMPAFASHSPLPDDAYVVLECSTAIGGGAFARRDDGRDILFATARMSWEAKEPGRNLRGENIRKEFREEFLVPVQVPVSKTESRPESHTSQEMYETELEETTKDTQLHGPTPTTESGILEMIEEEEESKYISMPDQLRDKFIPLYFVELCTKEMIEDESVVITPDMAEAAKKERHARIEGAVERMRELQIYNETFVLGKQKKRCQLVERLNVDATWSPELAQVLEGRDDAVAQEALERSLSASKKKQEAKKK